MKFNIWVSFDADEEPVTALSSPVYEDGEELLERAIAMSLEEWEYLISTGSDERIVGEEWKQVIIVNSIIQFFRSLWLHPSNWLFLYIYRLWQIKKTNIQGQIYFN